MYGRYKQQHENNSDKGISDSSRPEFSAVWGSGFQTNPIMPEPCSFISRKLPRCSIIRPNETKGIAMNVVNFLTAMGLFIGQSPAFFASARAGSYAIWRASFCPLNAESHLYRNSQTAS
jgi:hypothetical protein